jgi:hypothetical protein
MDKLTQRLHVAQDFSQRLLTYLSMPAPPPRSVIQALIDEVNAKLKAIDAQPDAPTVPLVAPNLLPPTVTPPAAGGATGI